MRGDCVAKMTYFCTSNKVYIQFYEDTHLSTMENTLLTDPIPHLIRKIAVPASIGFFFNTMYNVVDTYFGGLQSTEALSALSLSFPVFFLIIAVGSGIASGLAVLIAHALGERDHEKAKHYAVQGLSFGFGISIILTVIGLSVAPSLFRFLGATDAYLSLSLSYMDMIFYGTPAFIFVFLLNAILNATGDTKSFRNFLITGFFLNFVFNAWFMFGGLGIPALGLAGVALGTVVVQVIGVVYLLYKVSKAGLLHAILSLRDFIPDWRVFKEISAQGFPASLSMMTIALGIFIITYYISIFGHGAVAAYGIATRIEQITLLPLIGLNIAVLTLIGQNNGARQFDRVREVYRRSLRIGSAVSIIATVFLFAFAKPMMQLFTADLSVTTIGATYLRIGAFVTGGYMILFMSDSALRGLKHPMFFLLLGFIRQIILPATIFTILLKVLHTGIIGIWWGIFGIVWGAAFVAFFYVRHILAKTLGLGESQ